MNKMKKSSKSFRVDDALWRQFKVVCANENLLVQDQVGKLVAEWTKRKLAQYNKNGNNVLPSYQRN